MTGSAHVSLTVLLIWTLNLVDKSTGKAEWLDKTFPVDLESSYLHLKTTSAVGSNDIILLWYYDEDGNSAGGFQMVFYLGPKSSQNKVYIPFRVWFSGRLILHRWVHICWVFALLISEFKMVLFPKTACNYRVAWWLSFLSVFSVRLKLSKSYILNKGLSFAALQRRQIKSYYWARIISWRFCVNIVIYQNPKMGYIWPLSLSVTHSDKV